MDPPRPTGRGPRGGRRIATGTIVAGIAIALVVAGLVAVTVVGSHLKPAPVAHPSAPRSAGEQHDRYFATRPAPSFLVHVLSRIPAAAFSVAGNGSALPPLGAAGSGRDLIRLPQAPELLSGTRPLVVFVAAEYCPYCAAIRWPLVIALERFGTLQHLDLTASSPLQPFGDTPSLSFRSTGYSSPFLRFSATEEFSNACPARDVVANSGRDLSLPTWESPAYVCNGVSFRRLAKPSLLVSGILSTVDSVPDFTLAKAGSIPFIDFGGRFAEAGTILPPALFHGADWRAVVASLGRPDVGLGRAILSVANRFTAILCRLTRGRPGSVCHSAAVRAAARLL